MILKRVRLKNFISHANTEIDFPLGVTAIVGPNGAGKTSIVDAIVFALFGDRVRGERVDDLIRRGAGSAEVELTFEAGKEYTVRWIRRRRGVDVTLSRSDLGVIANTKDAVLDEISRILKMDKECAMNSIFIRQGEIAKLIDADPRTRKNLFGKLIGLDRLERAWEKMRELISYFEDIKNKLERDVQRVESELNVRREQMDRLKDDAKTLEVEIGNIERDLEVVKDQLNTAKEELDMWDDKRESYNSLRLELTEVDEKLKALKKDIEDLKERLERSKDAIKKLKELEPEVAKIAFLEEYVERLRDLDDLINVRDQLKRDLDMISDIKRDVGRSVKTCNAETVEGAVPEDLPEIQRFVARVTAQIDGITRQIANKEKELERLTSSALELLPEATVDAKDVKMRELKERKDKLEEKISDLKDRRGRIRGRIKDLEEALRVIGEAETCPVCRTRLTPEHRERVKDEIKREIRDLKEDQKRVEEEIKGYEVQKNEVEKELDRVSRIDVERIEMLREEIKRDYEEISQLCKALHLTAQKVNDLEKELNLKISDVDKNLKEIEKDLKDIAEKIGYEPKDPEGDLKALRKKKEEYDRLKPIADEYEVLAQKLDEKYRNLNKLEERMREIQKKIGELGYDERKHEEVRGNYEKLLRLFERKKAELKEKRNLLQKKLENLKEEEEKIARLEADYTELKNKLDNITKFISKLNNIRDAFSRDGVQKLLRQRIAPLISEFAREYVERFNLDITDISVDENFDISIIKEGGEISIKSISGGEKVAVAIALRLAIAKALAGKISTIVMDEPTTHLDEERRRELVEIMKSFFREGSAIPQMIVITHHRELEDVADTVYRIEKVNGVSKVVIER